MIRYTRAWRNGPRAGCSQGRLGPAAHSARPVPRRFCNITEHTQMATARVFCSGNSQAVRLPKEFRLKGKEVEIFRRGDEIVLREKGKGLARAFEILAQYNLIAPAEDFHH